MRRSPAHVVRTLEYGLVDLPPPWNTAAVRERLDATALRSGVRAFEIRGRRLFARGVVGVVDLGDLAVEILPKTHEGCAMDEAALFLTDLIGFTGSIDAVSASEARVAGGERNLLDLLLAWASRTLAANVRDGIPRRYQVRDATSVAIRGRVQLQRIACRAPGRDFEVPVRHAPLSRDNPVSRALKWLARELGTLSRSMATRRICARLLGDMDDVHDAELTLAALDGIVLQPTEDRWRALLAFARLLLLQVHPDPGRAGEHDAVAVLFTLHDLFEEVLRRVFRDGLGTHALSLRHSDLRLLRTLPEPGAQRLHLRPDFLFADPAPNGTVMVGDAKWKSIMAQDGSLRVDEGDAYQVAAYLAAFRARTGFLFCPLAFGQFPGLRIAAFRVAGQDAVLNVTGIHLPTLISPGGPGVDVRAALCAHVASGRSRLEPAPT